MLVIVVGYIIACRDKRLKTEFGFLLKAGIKEAAHEGHERDPLFKNKSTSSGHLEKVITEYSLLSDKQDGLAINMTNHLEDPMKRMEADKIQEEWRQKSHNPSVSEVKKAALLVTEGYLKSVEIMNIDEIPRDTMDELSSIVTDRV